MKRRKYLIGVGVLGVSPFAGCTEGGQEEKNPGATEGDENEESVYDISITLPTEAAVGEEISSTWAVENTGDATGEGTIRIRAEVDGDEEVLEERQVAIAAGETIDGTIVETATIAGKITVYVEAPDGSSTSSTLQVMEGADNIDEDAAERHMEVAADEIQSATDLLIKAIDNDDVQLDDVQFRSRLDDAETELEEADALATAEQDDQIEDLRNLIEVLSLRGETELAAEEGFDEHLGASLEQYWAGRDRQNRADAGVSDLEEAVEQFDAAETSFDSAQSSFERGRMSAEDAEGVLEGITPEVVNAFDNLSHVDAVQELKGTISVLEELEVFAGGAGDGCRGVTHVSEGFIAYMGKNWEESKSEFQTAKSSFDAAVESLDTVSFDRVSFLLTFFSEMLCEIGEGPEASEHWISASETAHEGDQETAGEEINEGWRLMAECHDS